MRLKFGFIKWHRGLPFHMQCIQLSNILAFSFLIVISKKDFQRLSGLSTYVVDCNEMSPKKSVPLKAFVGGWLCFSDKSWSKVSRSRYKAIGQDIVARSVIIVSWKPLFAWSLFGRSGKNVTEWMPVSSLVHWQLSDSLRNGGLVGEQVMGFAARYWFMVCSVTKKISYLIVWKEGAPRQAWEMYKFSKAKSNTQMSELQIKGNHKSSSVFNGGHLYLQVQIYQNVNVINIITVEFGFKMFSFPSHIMQHCRGGSTLWGEESTACVLGIFEHADIRCKWI